MANEKKYTITIELLIDYLIKYTSECHKVSIMEISSYFVQRIDFFEELEKKSKKYAEKWDDLSFDIDNQLIEIQKVYVASNSTVNSQIRRLLDKYLMKTMPCGVSIWASVDYDVAKAIENTRKVFYAKRLLDENSINLLCDAIEIFPYAETVKTANIINSLNMLTPYYNRRKFIPDRISAVKFPCTYYENLEEIYKAFRAVKDDEIQEEVSPKDRKLSQSDYNKMYVKGVNQISFKYYEYDENKKLKIKKLKNGEEVRVINPVKLIWTNGYYYLVAASLNTDGGKKRFAFYNYRVDRMSDVKCLDSLSEYIPDSNSAESPEKRPETFPLEYAKKNPVMYSDNSENQKSVVMICSKKLINNALDTFGFGIGIAKTDDPEKVEITIRKTSYTGVKMWALEYGYGCEIIAPPELRKQMKEAAQHLMDIYN